MIIIISNFNFITTSKKKKKLKTSTCGCGVGSNGAVMEGGEWTLQKRGKWSSATCMAHSQRCFHINEYSMRRANEELLWRSGPHTSSLLSSFFFASSWIFFQHIYYYYYYFSHLPSILVRPVTPVTFRTVTRHSMSKPQRNYIYSKCNY